MGLRASVQNCSLLLRCTRKFGGLPMKSMGGIIKLTHYRAQAAGDDQRDPTQPS
jgi:hypothetical protein